MSGYSHLAGLALAAFGALALVVRSAGHADALVTSVVYGVCTIALYAASSAYHLFGRSDAVARRLRKLDHGAIFLMIAGTCTPVFWHAFAGGTRVWMLVATWALAVLGIAMRVLWMGAPRALYTAMYVGMGWLFVVQGPRGFHALPTTALALIVAGGVTYTAGAVVYALKRPDPFPRVLGFHGLWHFFVLGGSAFHYAAILALAAP